MNYKDSARSSIKVSVCVVCYNQEKYIKQCLESVLKQETNFDFEVIVGDDASTDSTRDIILKLQETYPDKLKTLFHEKNIGAYDNVLSVYRAATGDYIAHLDGDDYFLPGKLQAQCDFMDENEDCAISFHRVNVLYGESLLKKDLLNINLLPAQGFTRSGLFQLVALGTNSSKMFRREGCVFPSVDFPVIDYFFNCYQVRDGRVKYVGGSVLGVYRAGIGIASANLRTREVMVKSFKRLLIDFPDERRFICAAVFIFMLADLKNRRKTWRGFVRVWLQSFDVRFFIEVLKRYKVIKMLRLP